MQAGSDPPSTSLSHATKWDYILNKEYLERKEEHRTHGYDWEEALQQITAILEPALPPVCACPLPCDRWQLPHREDRHSVLDDRTFDIKDEYVQGEPYDPTGRVVAYRAWRRDAMRHQGQRPRVRDRLEAGQRDAGTSKFRGYAFR